MKLPLTQRVLTHVPTPRLHESYNAVLQEEFTSVSQTLDNVVAAYVKLEEVRDAVSKLQQQSHEPLTGGRSSESLGELADDTMQLQRQLQLQVEKLGVGMEMAQLERKRKRAATTPSAVTLVPSEGQQEVMSYTAAKKPKPDVDSDSGSSKKEVKRSTQMSEKIIVEQEVTGVSGSERSSSSESESDDNSNDAEGSEAAWKPLTAKAAGLSTQVQSGPDSTAALKPLIKSATYMKTIVEAVKKIPALDRSFIIPEVLTALKDSVEEDVDGMQKSEVDRALRIVGAWLDSRKQLHVPYAGLYREYVAVVGSYANRLPVSIEKSKLKRMKGILTSRINRLGGELEPGSKAAEVVAAIEEAKVKKPFSNVAQYRNVVPFEKRIQWPLHVLVSFKKETADGVSKNSFDERLIKVYGKISRWFRADPCDPHQVLLYRMILNAVRELVNRTPKLPTKHRVINMLEDMTEAVSDPTNLTRLTKIRSCIMEIIAEVKQYQTRLIEHKQANKLTYTVSELAKKVAMGWNPYLDATMCKCVKELKTVVERAKASSKDRARGIFEGCTDRLAKWKIDDPPNIV